jgi:hypothetical protein
VEFKKCCKTGIIGKINNILSEIHFNILIPESTSLKAIPKLLNIKPNEYLIIVVVNGLIRPIEKNPIYNLKKFFNKGEFFKHKPQKGARGSIKSLNITGCNLSKIAEGILFKLIPFPMNEYKVNIA